MSKTDITQPAAAPRRPFAQKSFIAAVVVLGLAAVGLNAGTAALKVHFKKEPVPLRHKLDHPTEGIASTLGPWVKVTEQLSLDPDMQHNLGTDQFAFRTYVDTRVVDAARVAEFEGKDEDEQGRLLGAIQSEHPEAVMSLNVTYYTGLVDTVTHIPDRCMIAGGYQPTSYEVEKLDVPFADARTRDVKFRFINFEDQTGRRTVPTRVAYFFHSNGHYDDNHLSVRFRLQDLRERHGYYAKVELMTTGRPGGGADTAASLAAVKDVLSHALPELERCLPDWQAVKQAAQARK